MAVFAALIASALWGTADFLAGTVSRRAQALTVTMLSQLCGLLTALLVLAGALMRGYALQPGWFLWWGVLCGVIGAGSILSFYRALADGNMSLVATVGGLGVMVPVVVGLVDSSHPTAGQIVGIGSVVFGTAISCRRVTGANNGVTSMAFAAVAAVGFGSLYIFAAKGAEHSVLLTVLTQRATTVTALVTIVMCVVVVRPQSPVRRELANWRCHGAVFPCALAIGVSDLAASAIYAWASKGQQLAIVSVLASLYPIVTIVLARHVLAERLRAVQFVGIACALVGTALLSV